MKLRSPLLGRPYFALLWFFLMLAVLPLEAQTLPFLNGGFEGGGAGSVPNWTPFGGGYDVDRNTKRNGDLSLRLDNANPNRAKGASQTVRLDQTAVQPIQVSGWSKAENVTGTKNSDYALYVDLVYNDGTTLWGEAGAFRTGTHDWERRRFIIFPQKPVKELTIYALFRKHTGTVWFDDLSLRELKTHLFDGQSLSFPSRPPGPSVKTLKSKDGLTLSWDAGGGIVDAGTGSKTTGGFFLRDVKNDGDILPLRGKLTSRPNGGVDLASGAAGIRASLRIEPKGEALALDAELSDLNKTERAVTLYFALPVEASGWKWGDDIRLARKIAGNGEYTNQTRVPVGATGGMSLYPFGEVSSETQGVGIASQMEWASTFRIFYSAETRLLVIAWEVALSGKTATWPPYNARSRAVLFRLSPSAAKWGFRAAAARFYALNPDGYSRRAKAEGIWIPFTDPAKVPRPADFGIAYHEGDNSVKSDDSLGILSFRYKEPSSYWLPMPADLPRTYETALKLLLEKSRQPKPDPEARAVFNSGIKDETGRFSLEFRREPWNDGALILLNPNPELPASDEQPTQGWLAYNLADAVKRYSDPAQTLDGEYLDSLESWGETLDFRPEHLKTCPYPIPYETDTCTPCVPLWYHVHTFTRFLRDELRNRGKLLFANATPLRYSAFSSLLDVMGVEVDWQNEKGEFTPDPDSVMNLRRTLSAKKPYLLLQNTDFDRFGRAKMERYFQTCLFYGLYPSCFSANASDNIYWENSKWIERDRTLFKQYIPLLQQVSRAGWEPVTEALSSNSAIGVERFGTRFLTIHNFAFTEQSAKIVTSLAGKSVSVLLGSETRTPRRTAAGLEIEVLLAPGETRLLEIR